MDDGDEDSTPVIIIDPMRLLLLQMLLRRSNEVSGWHKANRVSRKALEERYPTACHFRRTPGNIAAIDFGTTFCSIAFATSLHVDVQNVKINIIELNKGHTRVPTAILLKKQCSKNSTESSAKYKIVYFGYDAVDAHSKLKSSERSEYLYFERFKMKLQKDKGVDRNMTVKSSDGCDFYLVEVIAFVLTSLKQKLVSHLEHTANPLKGEDFDWVVTVPAIWTARGKRMMREAAYMAGLTSTDPEISSFIDVGKEIPRPRDINPDKLTLALEPEVAAIYCQTMGQNEIAEHCKVDGSFQSSQYLIVDIGGGTVDITVHHLNQEDGVKVIVPPVGNSCGGTMVNQEFSKFLQEIVGDQDENTENGFSQFLASRDQAERAQKNAIISKLLYVEFEKEKVSFGLKSDDNPTGTTYSVRLPSPFVKFYGLAKIGEGVKALKDRRVELEDDTLYIEPTKFASFFDSAMKGIIECTSDVLKQLSGQIDTVYLVGGFGGCKYMYQKIKSMITSQFSTSGLRVIIPKEHKLAVVQGAVKYRLKPDIIHSRAMDASYGTDIVPQFNPMMHDHRYAGRDSTGTVRVEYVYMKFVEKGEQMSSDEVVTTEFTPLSNEMTTMSIVIYSSFKEGVKYICTPDGNPAPSVHKVAELSVEMPNPENLPPEQRRVELTMDFNNTEIQMRARYLVTGAEVKVVADFLTDQ